MAMPILVWLMSCVSTSTRATTRKGVMITTHLMGVPATVTVSDRKGMVG